MTPEQLRNILLYSPRTDEMYASLPKDAVGLATRPFAKANDEAKSGRSLRRLVLIAAFAWIVTFHRNNEIGLYLILIVGAYEFAYGNAAKVRADLEDMQERERLRIEVDKYLRKTFPEYKPPKQNFTIFSVSPNPKEGAGYQSDQMFGVVSTQVAIPPVVIYVCAGMLFLGAAPLPYDYYTLLRFIGCGVFALAAYVSFNRSGKILPWVFVLFAIVFNPFVTVHLSKELWAIVDVVAGLLLLATSKHIKSKGSEGA